MNVSVSEDLSISDGLDLLLSHFGGDNSLWPKFIAAGSEWHMSVQNKQQAVSKFFGAKLMDCRICPYPDFVESFRKSDARGADCYGGIGIIPDFIMIDVDGGMFKRSLFAYVEDALNATLNKILDRMDEKFYTKYQPTILWTGNGYHIYQPVQLSGPCWCLGYVDAFMDKSDKPDVEFLRWAEWYLSDGLADQAHYTTTSFNNMYCRVPGSFNSKNGEPIRVLQEWNGDRPYINWILRDFHDFLVVEANKPLKRKYNGLYQWEFSSKW